MKSIKAFFIHSSIRIHKFEKFQRRNFFITGRFYSGYVGVYINCKQLNFSFCMLLFAPEPECKQAMIKGGTYGKTSKQIYGF